ncbi:glycosyltransferase family 2 protein [Methylobacter sp.]|uniref:glycosyltransferase family 2 protein n=1 Tax=Methylobacter sp. TaxID=2051955 RepID=UPI002FDE69DC
MERSRIAIIVPALNEAATIGAVLARVKEYGLPIVVDDGSSDATAALAREAGAEVVTHQQNRGYDGALNSGFARAAALGCAYAITIDADGQHNPAQLQELIAYLNQDYELVLGVRDRYQRIGEVIFAYCTKCLWNISDPLCGMKGYSLDLFNKAGHFDSFQSIGTELAVRSLVNGCRYIEMPILTRDRQDEPRFARKFAANYKILRAMTILVLRYSMNKLKN